MERVPTFVDLGRVEIGDEIGSGGFGVVHRATLPGHPRPLAVKFLYPHPFNARTSNAAKRFAQEAEFLFKLRHPSIIAVYSVGEADTPNDDKVPFILMEWFDGFDLPQARQHYATLGSEIEPPAVLKMLGNVVSALSYAHSLGIVHRDLKPTNIMSARGEARILDFGVAAVLDPEGVRLTQTGGTFVGDSFSAPELSTDSRLVDRRCDIYSIGACWYWLLTGLTPKGAGVMTALKNTGVSREYEAVLVRCLSDITRRYQTADDLLRDIRALEGGERPSRAPDELGDHDLLVLGVLHPYSLTWEGGITIYEIRRQCRTVSELAVGIAIKKLQRLSLVGEIEIRSYNESQTGFAVTPAAEEVVELHQEEIELLIERNKPQGRTEPIEEAPIDDDIPF